jgi:hypothetical protein
MRFAFRRRSFLNPTTTSHTSYIDAIIESSQDGEYQIGSNVLTLADCRRVVRIEFFLGNKRERRRSLKKINLLIDILTAFRSALERESNLIDGAK